MIQRTEGWPDTLYVFEWGNDDFIGDSAQYDAAVEEWRDACREDDDFEEDQEPETGTWDFVGVLNHEHAVYKHDPACRKHAPEWKLVERNEVPDYTEIATWDYDPRAEAYSEIIQLSERLTLREASAKYHLDISSFGFDKAEREEMLDTVIIYDHSGCLFLEQTTFAKNGFGLYHLKATVADQPAAVPAGHDRAPKWSHQAYEEEIAMCLTILKAPLDKS